MRASRSFTGSRQCVGAVSVNRAKMLQGISEIRKEAKERMREPEMYRPMLESLLSVHPDKRLWSQSDVARELNKSRGWVRDTLGVSRNGITTEALAWKLAKDFV